MILVILDVYMLHQFKGYTYGIRIFPILLPCPLSAWKELAGKDAVTLQPAQCSVLLPLRENTGVHAVPYLSILSVQASIAHISIGGSYADG